MNKPARPNVLPLQQEPERNEASRTGTAPKRSRKKWNVRNLFLLAFLTWAGYVFFFEQAPDIERLKQEQKRLSTEISQMQETNKELQRKIEQLNDPEYIAELARKKYLMVKEGETLFVQPKQ
jgi:cell division protein DivIC